VLSGGGSKGTAHIGVIKALEENHIPIDFIAGTSIGAIIGGLYVSGWTVEEMEAYVTNPEFQKMADGIIDEQYIYYSTLDDPNSAWFNIKFRMDSSITTILPTNIITPDRIDFQFMELFTAVNVVGNCDFDSLLIPFRCVASDIGSNKAVVFNNGDLGRSIRASMTFPFYFNPVVIDSMILFDGGMYNNFPSDIMYNDFYPDIIIGSKVASNYAPPKEGDVVSQLETIFMHNTEYSVLCENSILIEPDLGPMSLLDFSTAQRFIDIGYQATIEKIDEIRKFVIDSVSPEEMAEKRQVFLAKKPEYLFDSIIVTGVNQNQARYIRKQIKHSDKLIDILSLRKEYYKLLSDDKIASITPSAVYNKETGHFDLEMDVRLNKNFQLDFGGNINSSAKSHVYLGLIYKRLGFFGMNIKLNGHIGRFYNSGNIAMEFDIPAKLPISLSFGYQYNNLNYFNSTTYFIDNETPIYLIQNESFPYIIANIPANNKGKFGLCFSKGVCKSDYYQTNQFTSTDTTDKTYFYVNKIGLYYDRMTLNKKQFPNRGTHLFIRTSYYNGRDRYFPGSTTKIINEVSKNLSYFQFKLYYENYFMKIGKRTKIGFKGELLLSNQPFYSNYISTLLNASAFYPNAESRTLFLNKFRAHNYAAAGFLGIISIRKNIDIRLESYYFQPYREIIRKDVFWAGYGKEFSSRFYTGSASIIYHTPIAPISFSVSYYESYDKPFSFLFGIGYTIFNNRLVD